MATECTLTLSWCGRATSWRAALTAGLARRTTRRYVAPAVLMSTDPIPAAEWWAKRRWPYNRALIIAGVSAFALYVAAFEAKCRNVPEAEITLFTTALQGIGYLLAMGCANVCFNFGRWAEGVMHPQNPARFRELTYRMGFWFSAALPFAIPLLTWWHGCAPFDQGPPNIAA